MRLAVSRRRWAVLAAAIGCTAAVGRCDDTLIWLDVVAAAPVEHAVMVRGPFRTAHEKVQLAGPVGLAAAGVDTGPCFTVYAVTPTGDEPARTVEVGAGGVPLRLGPPAFLLVPARRLREGEPATDAPSGVYEARPLVDPPDTIDGSPATAGRPTHLCLPVDYRHHFERVPVVNADRGLLLFAARAAKQAAAPVAVADDFGLNRLSPRGPRRDGVWIVVRETNER